MIRTIIPTPRHVEVSDEKILLPLAVCCHYASWNPYLETFHEAFEQIYELQPAIAEGGITIVHDASLAPRSYRYHAGNGITISASDEEGILYAIATVLQAIIVQDGKIYAEKAFIEDYPEKEYRALMIDLAREWHPVHTIHQYIDMCFFLKIKYLHLHFIDDERYTLPSTVFPHITDGNRFYSFEDIEAMRAHAQTRGVLLIPEFEAPGHAAALNRHYPEIFAPQLEDGQDIRITTEAGAVIDANHIVCAGSQKTMEGIQAILEEICRMFPEAPYIHIGGDEANIEVWNHCTESIAYMKRNHIENVYELYSDFVGRVARMVLDLGRTPIVWEGFPHKGAHRIPRETIVIAWESHYNMAYDLLADGFRIINGSWKPLYHVPNLSLTWGPKDILAWDVYSWQHWWPNSEARLNPIHVAPTDQVLGGQYSSWQCTFEQEISRVMENLAALAERTWSVRRHWDDEEYEKRFTTAAMQLARLIQTK